MVNPAAHNDGIGKVRVRLFSLFRPQKNWSFQFVFCYRMDAFRNGFVMIFDLKVLFFYLLFAVLFLRQLYLRFLLLLYFLGIWLEGARFYPSLLSPVNHLFPLVFFAEL